MFSIFPLHINQLAMLGFCVLQFNFIEPSAPAAIPVSESVNENHLFVHFLTHPIRKEKAMISLDILNQDILDLERNHDTTWATVERLAWLYIVRDHLTGSASKSTKPVSTDGSSDFLAAADGLDTCQVLDLMDELMDTLQVIAPALYHSAMLRLDALEPSSSLPSEQASK